MTFRFQKRISILPGVRINLSKSGVSTSLGPRGADVNVGKDGVTANAGIPGTGLSYRQKISRGGKGFWLAVLLVVGGLGVWAFQHSGQIEKTAAPARPTTASISTDLSPKASTDRAPTSPASTNAPANMLRYVHRQNAILRDKPKPSGRTLKKESKGAQVMLLAESEGWAKVTDGNITGWMRSSILGTEPPQ
jgi:hypothetical protein